ncbi:N-alpha-acetyltransferase 35, NatC auxiliary subunit [Trichinella patagoniensis]|uniref:Protein MAK10 homolog n=1 Tax=Trichinella patagoniensis TaxID=990121 RepID=A0A0V0Z6H0_9BILA|nr:N-alpha-acetyltransferase 35, NatC auxiliary subunit [Trichinella patagoniensis]
MSQFLLTSDYLPTSSDCHEYLSLSNDSWIDIHEWFKGEAERLEVGEIVMPSEFILSKTVSVLDINNGKLYSYEEIDPILSWYYKLAVKKGQVLLKEMPHQELIKVFDAIFVTMVSWMINYHVMDGIFRNLYLHHPGNIEYTYLSAYCNLALKCISLIISILRRGGVCDEQDFHYLPLPSDIITGNLHLAAHVSAADVICQACQADTQAYNQAQSDSKQHPSPAAELASNQLSEIRARISFLLQFYYVLHHCSNTKCENVDELFDEMLSKSNMNVRHSNYICHRLLKRIETNANYIPNLPFMAPNSAYANYMEKSRTCFVTMHSSVNYMKLLLIRIDLMMDFQEKKKASLFENLTTFIHSCRGEADPLVRSLMQVSNVEMKCGRMSFNQLALFLKIMFNPGNYERSAFDFQILTSMCDFLGPATMLKLSERINRSANYGPFRDILNKSAAAFPELYRAYGYNDSRRIYHLRKSLITFRNLMNSAKNLDNILTKNETNLENYGQFSTFFEHIMLDIVREISLNALALKLYEPYDLLFVFEFLHKKVINRKLEILRHVQHCTVETNFKSEEHTTPFYFPWLYYEELISAEIVDVYFLFTAYMNSMTEIKLPYYFKKPDDLEIHFKRKFPEIVILNDYLSFGLKEYTYQCLHKRSSAEGIAALQSCCKPFESPDIPFKSNEFARLETLANKNRVLANLMCNAKDRFLPVGFEINPSVHYLWPLIKIRDKNQKTVDPKAKDQAKKE